MIPIAVLIKAIVKTMLIDYEHSQKNVKGYTQKLEVSQIICISLIVNAK